MRATFYPQLSILDQYSIKGDAAHHLVNVVRIEMGEKILLLNGEGLKVITQVSALNKKEVLLTYLSSEEIRPVFQMDLALGVPKKEALELSLKQAVELGFRKIYLIRSSYSQTRVPEADRVQSLLVSALEQSNSAFLPEIVQCEWNEIPADSYQEILMLDSQNATQGKAIRSKKSLLVVGPEGGFSPDETTYLHSWPNIRILNLPTPIMRTPTAVAAGAGIVLGSLLD